MQIKKTASTLINNIALFTAGFTIVHGLLFAAMMIKKRYFDHIIYHYSTNLYWVLIFVIIPVIGGICFNLLFRKQRIPVLIKGFFLFCLLAQIVFTVYATQQNYKYWGYSFTRPPVFKELTDAEQILTLSRVTNVDTVGINPLHVNSGSYQYDDTLYGRKDPYYGENYRALMLLEDINWDNLKSLNFRAVYEDVNKKINSDILKDVEIQISQTYAIMHENNSYGNKPKINGLLIEFSTVDNTKYIYSGLDGGEISNDHFPFYEFLFEEQKGHYQLVKKQMFFYDVAGAEGIEYAIVAPFFSLVLAIIGLFFSAFTIIGINLIFLFKK